MTREMRAHCLVLPYPIQGHINPMLQFSKRLEHKGVKITLAITRFMSKTINEAPGSIVVDTISDGYDEGWGKEKVDIDAYLTKFQQVGSETLAQLIEKLCNSGNPIDCIIYDAFLPWVIDITKEFGLLGAVFFTQSCAVDNIYYHICKGLLKLPIAEPPVMVVGLPSLELSDMPSFISVPGSYPSIFQVIINQFSNIDKVDWILFNTFYELEEEVVDWMAKLWPLMTIGPTIPSMYLDRQLLDDKDYGLSMFNPNSNACINWLNKQQNTSVVYVSFGSLAELGVAQMEELAYGLGQSDIHFLWVVRTLEESKLPKNFMEETSEKGLVVSWCPQLEVLAHASIGCFVTHCGWNSTLEALSLGVPMVAIPQWTDQSTNAKYVKDIWKMGVKAQQDEKGIVRREVIEKCVWEILKGEKGKEIRGNASKWKEMARKAVGEGGSSARNINEFVAKLLHN